MLRLNLKEEVVEVACHLALLKLQARLVPFSSYDVPWRGFGQTCHDCLDESTSPGPRTAAYVPHAPYTDRLGTFFLVTILSCPESADH